MENTPGFMRFQNYLCLFNTQVGIVIQVVAVGCKETY